MSFTYLCQKHADEHKNKILTVPVTTKISDEYLLGLDNASFIKSFSTLQDIAASIYDDMINSPEGYGLKMIPVTEGSVNLVSCFGNILYAFGILGTLSEKKLIIDVDLYKKMVQKHNSNKVQLKLQDFGFVIDGFNGKTFDRGLMDFSVSYPDDPDVIITLKALSFAAQPFIENATTDKYYIDDVFNLFSFRPLEDRATQIHETMFLMMTDHYSDKIKVTLYAFHKKMKMLGFKYPGLYGSISYEKNGIRNISFGYGATKDIISARIIFKDIEQLKSVIQPSNMKINSPFRQSTCKFCAKRETPDKPCPKRVTHEFDGKTYHNCKMLSFVFNDIQLADIDDLIKLIKIEYRV